MTAADILANAYVELRRYFTAKEAGNNSRAQLALERLRTNLATIHLGALRPAAREEISTFIDIISHLDTPEYARDYNRENLLSFLAPFALNRPIF